MKLQTFPILAEHESQELYDALYYLSVAQLCNVCLLLSLPTNSNKQELINHIMHYLQTGSILKVKEIPPISRAKNYQVQPLEKNALMLYGSYKNDAKTRAFFKTLIGQQFHFTAFGIDWLQKRWQQGKPPTYQEFANYWLEEIKQRKLKPVEPKKEWAYINFMQKASKIYPELSKEELRAQWKRLQKEKAEYALEIIKKITADLF